MTSKSANGRVFLRALLGKLWAALRAREVLTLLSLFLLPIMVVFVFLKFFPPQNPDSMANAVTLFSNFTAFSAIIFAYVFVASDDHARALYAIAVS